jgi:hypothetical protein
MGLHDVLRRFRRVGGGVALSAGLLIAGAAQAQSLSGYQLYGIKGSTNELYRHDFRSGAGATLGVIQSREGQVFEDVQATAYIPGHSNLIGFWKDSSDGNSKLLYIDMNTGRSAVVGSADLGPGRVTGAVAVMDAPSTTAAGSRTSVAQSRAHVVYAIQQSVTVNGTINLNPSNSPLSEFLLKKPDGTWLTRDDLKNATKQELYAGPATFLRVSPKSNGTQNMLQVDGGTYTINNSGTYEFSGTVTARVYNTSSNLSMGSWSVDVTSTGVQVSNPGGTQSILGRLIQVDHKTGAHKVLMKLARNYESLAAVASDKFYATYGNELYELNPATGAETLLGSTPTAVQALEFAGNVAYGFENTTNALQPLWEDGVGPAIGLPVVTGASNLRSIVFVRTPDAPKFSAYD